MNHFLEPRPATSKVRRGVHVSQSHRTTAPSQELEMSRVPHVDIETLITQCALRGEYESVFFLLHQVEKSGTDCRSSSTLIKFPEAESHMRTVLSSAPEITLEPSGVINIQFMPSVCPSIVNTCSPVATSHTRLVKSQEPETMRRLFGDHATHAAGLGWPRRFQSRSPDSAFHS